jgi:hypothetical protein
VKKGKRLNPFRFFFAPLRLCAVAFNGCRVR